MYRVTALGAGILRPLCEIRQRVAKVMPLCCGRSRSCKTGCCALGRLSVAIVEQADEFASLRISAAGDLGSQLNPVADTLATCISDEVVALAMSRQTDDFGGRRR